jgi:hypothetical protein
LLNEGNIGLVFMRQVASSSDYTHVIVSRSPVDARACYSNKGIIDLAPLYLHDSSTSKSHTLFSDTDGIVSNLHPKFAQLFESFARKRHSNSDQEIFDYIVGVLGSVAYCNRYASLLKIDFPRVPIPKANALFAKVSVLGSRLISLQLLEEKIALTEQPKYFGSKEVVVGKVAHIDDVLWIDSSAKDPEVGTSGFSGVSEDVFRFELGGYQICEKWFKDRRGKSLSQVERDHARKMLASISKIIAIQVEIDELIEGHGGFPEAFV